MKGAWRERACEESSGAITDKEQGDSWANYPEGGAGGVLRGGGRGAAQSHAQIKASSLSAESLGHILTRLTSGACWVK